MSETKRKTCGECRFWDIDSSACCWAPPSEEREDSLRNGLTVACREFKTVEGEPDKKRNVQAFGGPSDVAACMLADELQEAFDALGDGWRVDAIGPYFPKRREGSHLLVNARNGEMFCCDVIEVCDVMLKDKRARFIGLFVAAASRHTQQEEANRET